MYRQTQKKSNTSKYNRKRKNQVVLLMIAGNSQENTKDKWHYIALKSIPTDDGFIRLTKSMSALFRGITSSNNGDFYCFGCLQPYRSDNALKKHERLCNKHDHCEPVMPSEDKKILQYNSGEKSLKVAHAFYLDLESLLIKTESCQNNPQESYTERKAIHEACGYSLNLVTSYDSIKNTHNYYRGKDCVKKLCKDLKDQVMEIINYEKKKMIPLTDDEKRKYKKQKLCHICEKEFCDDKSNGSEYKI